MSCCASCSYAGFVSWCPQLRDGARWFSSRHPAACPSAAALPNLASLRVAAACRPHCAAAGPVRAAQPGAEPARPDQPGPARLPRSALPGPALPLPAPAVLPLLQVGAPAYSHLHISLGDQHRTAMHIRAPAGLQVGLWSRHALRQGLQLAGPALLHSTTWACYQLLGRRQAALRSQLAPLLVSGAAQQHSFLQEACSRCWAESFVHGLQGSASASPGGSCGRLSQPGDGGPAAQHGR